MIFIIMITIVINIIIIIVIIILEVGPPFSNDLFFWTINDEGMGKDLDTPLIIPARCLLTVPKKHLSQE